MSDVQPVQKEISYEEIAEQKAKRYKYMMRRSLIMSVIFAVIAGANLYSLATFNFPTYLFVLLVILFLFVVIASLGALFDAGRFSEIKDYEPSAWKQEGKYKELEKSFVQDREMYNKNFWSLWSMHMAFSFFVRHRSPELAAEFATSLKDQQPPDEASKKEDSPS